MTRSRRHHGGHEEEPENGERWLLTYADMITLLLALFIVLFAISTINQKKFLALALGLKQSFDPKPGILRNSTGLLQNASLTQTVGSKLSTVAPLSVTTTTLFGANPATSAGSAGETAVTVPPSELSSLERRIQAALVAQHLQAYVSLQVQARGLVVQILADKVFFATGSADIGPIGNDVIDTVASVLRSDPHEIDIEGYTDNQPVTGGVYSSNEELSAVRAVNVVLRLENTDGIAPKRLSATGYGESRPIAPNDSPAHMALNRRIDIVILSSTEAQP